MSKRLFVTQSARVLGCNIVSGRGTGKSRYMGRFLLTQDAIAQTPTIVIDPIGDTINNFFTKVSELPKDKQGEIWPRVVYIDMAGKEKRVIPFPFFTASVKNRIFR